MNDFITIKLEIRCPILTYMIQEHEYIHLFLNRQT